MQFQKVKLWDLSTPAKEHYAIQCFMRTPSFKLLKDKSPCSVLHYLKGLNALFENTEVLA
jgi:hypothetical protein